MILTRSRNPPSMGREGDYRSYACTIPLIMKLTDTINLILPLSWNKLTQSISPNINPMFWSRMSPYLTISRACIFTFLPSARLPSQPAHWSQIVIQPVPLLQHAPPSPRFVLPNTPALMSKMHSSNSPRFVLPIPPVTTATIALNKHPHYNQHMLGIFAS